MIDAPGIVDIPRLIIIETEKCIGHIGNFELVSACSELPKEPELTEINKEQFLITSLPNLKGKLKIDKYVPFYHRFEKKRKKKKF